MNIKTYFKASYDELVHKVSWPTWPELQSSAIVVLAASVIIAIIVLIMDASFRNIMHAIYNMFF